MCDPAPARDGDSASRSDPAFGAASSYRDDFSRGEVVHAYLWLAGFALISALLEAVYLDARLFGVPAPLSVPVAAAFNLVLTRTAGLWTRSKALRVIPTAVWLAGIVLVAAAVPGMGQTLSPSRPLAIALVVAGIAGGVFPVAHPK